MTAKLTTQFRLRLLDPNMEGVGTHLFSFASPDGFFSTLRQHGQSLAGLFRSPSYALLLLSGGIAAARLASVPPSFLKRYSLGAPLGVVVSCLVVAGSHWVELNKGDLRYLSIAFFLLVLAILLAISAEVKRRWRAIQYVLLLGSVTLHLSSSIPRAHDLPSTRDTLSPLLTSGCSAFIGDYWTAYLVAGMFPDRFLATPHEGSTVRSQRMREMVLAQPEICLIKEGWLDKCPSEMKEFGNVLTQIGLPQPHGRFTICRYAQERPP